jgi:late competence protein required for DNA uptake (superfamily II DNA/RNA helicase)
MDKKEISSFQEGYQKGFTEGFTEGQQLFKNQVINRMKENNLMLKEVTFYQYQRCEPQMIHHIHMCCFCCQKYKPQELKPLSKDKDPSTHLKKLYCQRCLDLYVESKPEHLWKQKW